MGNFRSKPKPTPPKQKIIPCPTRAICSDEPDGSAKDLKIFKCFKRDINVSLKDWILLLRKEKELYKKLEEKALHSYVSPKTFEQCSIITNMERKARKPLKYHRDVLPIPRILPAPPVPPPSAPRQRPIPLTTTARLRIEKALEKRNGPQKMEGLLNHNDSDLLPGSVPSSSGAASLDSESIGTKKYMNKHHPHSLTSRNSYQNSAGSKISRDKNISRIFNLSGKMRDIKSRPRIETPKLLSRVAHRLQGYVDEISKKNGDDISSKCNEDDADISSKPVLLEYPSAEERLKRRKVPKNKNTVVSPGKYSKLNNPASKRRPSSKVLHQRKWQPIRRKAKASVEQNS